MACTCVVHFQLMLQSHNTCTRNLQRTLAMSGVDLVHGLHWCRSIGATRFERQLFMLDVNALDVDKVHAAFAELHPSL